MSLLGEESRRDPLLWSCSWISPQRRLTQDDDAPHDQVVISVTNQDFSGKVMINWKIISKYNLQCKNIVELSRLCQEPKYGGKFDGITFLYSHFSVKA